MVKGGNKGKNERSGGSTDPIVAHLNSKTYKDGLNDMIKNTAVRANDLDSKALSLLDILQKRGKAKEACSYLKENLKDLSRDHVSNWRGYVYTLLRGYDEDAYQSMKTEQDSGRKRARDQKRGSDSSMGDVKSELSTAATSTPEGKQERGGRKTAPMNEAASEFVPGKPWDNGKASGAAKGEKGGKPKASPKKTFTPDAEPFVPGQPWKGASNKGKKGKGFSKSAPEFIPGQAAWQGYPAEAYGKNNWWAAPAQQGYTQAPVQKGSQALAQKGAKGEAKGKGKNNASPAKEKKPKETAVNSKASSGSVATGTVSKQASKKKDAAQKKDSTTEAKKVSKELSVPAKTASMQRWQMIAGAAGLAAIGLVVGAAIYKKRR